MSLTQEFKAFVMRGNVVDLAIGVIIGAAFGKIISALVDKIIMPPIGIISGKVNFADLKFVLQNAVIDATGKVIEPEVNIGYGAFLQTIIDFIIIAFCIFVAIKIYQAMVKREEDKPAPPAPPSKEQELLTEIRDLLKAKQ